MIIALAVIAVVISIIGIQQLTYGSLSQIPLITGLATGAAGGTNVSVSTAIDMTVVQDTINFTSTNPGVSRSSINNGDVIGCSTDLICGFNITNDGSVLINISAAPQGDLFGSAATDADSFKCNVSANIQNYDTVNSEGHTSMTDCRNNVANGFEDFGAVVANLNYTDSSDDVYIDIDISVPPDESPGYKGSTIIFTASQAT